MGDGRASRIRVLAIQKSLGLEFRSHHSITLPGGSCHDGLLSLDKHVQCQA